MPKTVTPPVSDADRPFEAARANPDGTVTLYYAGETAPLMPPPSPSLPQLITKRQLYRGLRERAWFGTTKAQIEAAVDALLAQMPEPPRELARIEFYTSRDYLRTNPMLVAALKAPPLSLTDAGIDEFWIFCASFAPDGE